MKISSRNDTLPPNMNPIGTFNITHKEGKARRGTFYTRSGSFQTPAFMPVGTQGTVKGITARELKEIEAEIILSNTYHLHIRPGEELIRDLGDIHKFMAWDGPILTDSGGFQVFSLSGLRKISDEGVRFQSHVDGKEILFTPESVMKIQETLGVDIMMVLDECLNKDATHEQARISWDRTLLWAKRSLDARERADVLPFAIVQGGMFEDLREKSVRDLTELNFPGYAIGGLSVGEDKALMRTICTFTAPLLPEDKPRYLMGVGTPLDIVESVYAGVDMFDCVMPTRSGRFGRIFTMDGFFNIRNSKYRTDSRPLEEGCDCYCCKTYSRAYISHLNHAKEMLGSSLASLHNLRFYQRLVKLIRVKIENNEFSSFREECQTIWKE